MKAATRDPHAKTPTRADVQIRSAERVWWRAYRHHLRLLRNQAIAWITVIAGVGALVAVGFEDTYPTLADRQRAAANLEGVPAFEALFGRTVELATVEGFVLWRWGGFAVLVVAVWGMLSSGRLLRGAEESGHLEPMRAGAITARGLLGAVVAALLTVYALLAVAVGMTHSAVGMDTATSWALGAVLGLLAATFMAAVALTSQVVTSRRQVSAVVGVALGVTLGVRVLAAGTDTPNWVWGITPFGWASYLHEVDGARVQVLGAYVALVAILLAAAFALAHRDLHEGRVGNREQTRQRARPISGQTGLAVRLTLGPIITWGAILGASGLVFGLLANDFARAMVDLPETVEAGERIGMIGLDTPEGVMASMLLFLVLVLGLFAAAQASAIREEEASWRIEALLVRRVGRVRWLATRTAVAAVVIFALAFVTAFAAWMGVAATGTTLALGDLPLTAFNLAPVTWMFLAIGIALFGLLPRRAAVLTYTVVLATYVLDLVGGLVELPETVLEISPFRHVTAVPVAAFPTTATLVMLAVAVLATAAGITAFHHRDLKEA